MTLFAFALLLAPLATVDYDYRYVIPAIGPLALAAAVGAAGLARRWRVSAAGRRRPATG